MFKQMLIIWLDKPDTPPDAWMFLLFAQIDALSGVNPHNACVQLPKIIAERTGNTEAEVRKIRRQYRWNHGLAKRP